MPGDYFIKVPANISGNVHLWESQVQGYLAIKDHFDKGATTPAVVVLPTGTGKTGLLAITPYGIASRRVLIVAPGLVIKRNIIDNLNPMNLDNFWLKRRVITSRQDLPVVVEFGSDTRREHLEMANFVITNIHMTQRSNPNSLLNTVPRDFFDMILIDEAHHSPAQSWVDLEEYFYQAKVVKVTGTPFRADGEKIVGELVYNYPLARAMVKGIVKGLIKQTWIGEELTFQIQDHDGSVKTVPYDEIKSMKESDWIARQVAYSPSCNRVVVQKSLEILREKRDATQKPHKIIAVACNIRHAEEICRLYEEEGAAATWVSSDLPVEENERRVRDFTLDRYQVIVNVGMLGEGFDHPYISIAAIFRPFKSPLFYAQFAGRALRAIPGGSKIDNTAHLVHHTALGLEELWEYYRKEQEHALVLERLEEIAEQIRRESAEPREAKPDPSVSVEELGIIKSEAESYLDDFDIVQAYNEALADIERRVQKAAEALQDQGITVTPDIIEAIRAAGENEYFRQKRPDLDYRERRKRLHQSIQDGVAEIIAEAGLDPKQPPTMFIAPQFRQYAWLVNRHQHLDGFLVNLVNYQLKDYIGRSREEWTTADVIRAQEKLHEYLDNLRVFLTGRGE